MCVTCCAFLWRSTSIYSFMVAFCCSVLQYVAMCCNVLQCVAMCSISGLIGTHVGNSECLSQVSFQTAYSKRNMNFAHSGFRFVFRQTDTLIHHMYVIFTCTHYLFEHFGSDVYVRLYHLFHRAHLQKRPMFPEKPKYIRPDIRPEGKVFYIVQFCYGIGSLKL